MTITACPTCHHLPDTPGHELGCPDGREQYGHTTPAERLHRAVFGDTPHFQLSAVTLDWVRSGLPSATAEVVLAVLDGRIDTGRLEVLSEAHLLGSSDTDPRTAWQALPRAVTCPARREVLQRDDAFSVLVVHPEPPRPAPRERTIDTVEGLRLLKADSVLVDSTGQCLIVGEYQCAGMQEPQQVLRTTRYRIVRQDDVKLPVLVVYETEDSRTCWRVSDSLETVMARHAEWSLRTFGPGRRLGGILKHIRKELAEIEADPDDPTEWIDLAVLALDGALRIGFNRPRPGMMPATELAARILAKYLRNARRQWPDWRLTSQDQPIEHVRNRK